MHLDRAREGIFIQLMLCVGLGELQGVSAQAFTQEIARLEAKIDSLMGEWSCTTASQKCICVALHAPCCLARKLIRCKQRRASREYYQLVLGESTWVVYFCTSNG